MSNDNSVVAARSRDNEISGIKAKEDIGDGDILLWRGNYLVSKIFAGVTSSRYTHAAFVIRWEGNPMVLEAGAFRIHALPFEPTVKRYNGQVYWYQLKEEKRLKLDIPRTMKEATNDLGLHFGVLSVLQAIAYRSFNWRISLHREGRRGMFCSEYVSKCFNEGGVDLALQLPDDRTFPDDIQNSPFLQFRARIHTARVGQHLFTRALHRVGAWVSAFVRAMRGPRLDSDRLLTVQSQPAPTPDKAPVGPQAPDVGPPAHGEAHPGDGGAP